MKIEMGESLMFSYLKHVKCCSITQMNWKISGNWAKDNTLYNRVLEELKENNNEGFFKDIFKTNFAQTIRQAEVDLVGLNNNKVYGVEVAYHDNGLRYGGDACSRVTKKLLRAYYLFKIYFPNREYKIMFVSPKVLNKTDLEIKKAIKELNKLIDGNIFSYFSNEDFQSQIVKKTLEESETESDTSELFVRSYRLANISISKTTKDNYEENEENEEIDERKIEKEIERVKTKIPRWLKKPNQINSTILYNFMELYSESDKVLLIDLKTKCSDLKNFSQNMSHLTKIRDNNDCKIFEVVDGVVSLWHRVKKIIIEEHKNS